MGSSQAFYSNQVEILYHHLKEALYSKETTPFTKRLIIVPSPAMKSWLMLKMAEDPDLGICAGILISHLDKTIQTLQDLLQKTPCSTRESFYAPNSLELSLSIERELIEHLNMYASMDQEKKKIWDPLLRYLQIAEPSRPLSRRSLRRLIALSERLSALFRQYGTYGEKWVKEWKSAPSDHWQIQLWQALYKKKQYWKAPFDLLSLESLNLDQKQNLQVHLFALSFISRIHHECIFGISQAVQVYYYLLSPCQAFWTDIRSEKERRSITKRWQAIGAAESQLQELDGYLRDNNPLLANFGRLGREMAQQLQENSTPSIESYVLPEVVNVIAAYEDLVSPDLLLSEKKNDLSLLEALQADLVLLRNPDATEPIEISPEDRSLQIHAAPSRYREVEILYHALSGLIDRHSKDEDPILPKDILVMAPDIAEYAPFIKAVFQSKESILDTQIMDLSMAAQNPIAQAFLHLLELSTGRWDAVSLLELIEMAPFQKKQQFTLEELSTWQEWVRNAAIRWGDDPGHREEILLRDYGINGFAEFGGVGTWENGLERLLAGMTTTLLDEEFAPADMQTVPVEGVSYTQASLLEKWVRILRSLRDDLLPLHDGSALNMAQWSSYLRCLCEAYLAPDYEDADSVSQYVGLLQQFDRLKNSARSLPEEKFRYDSIGPRLEQLLHEERVTYRETSLQAVRFCSLLPMRALPAKVIVWMGMEDGAFPRQDTADSLNLLMGSTLADYAPSTSDFDRYLFLEALISARRYFLVTYSMLSSEGGAEKPPSLLIEELLSYLDKAYIRDGNPGSLGCRIEHPFQGYDAKYFSAEADFPSYSLASYREAVAHYRKEKEPTHVFIPNFAIGEIARPTEGIIRIDLKQLRALARDPMKSYLNKKLGIYLENREDLEIQTEENVFLSNLDLHQLRQGCMQTPVREVLSHAERTGLLPSGQFKRIAEKNVEQDFEEIVWKLREEGIELDKIHSVVFAEDCYDPVREEGGGWRLPAFTLQYNQKTTIMLTGSFSQVCREGLLLHEEDKFEGHLKVWPEYLLFKNLIDKFQLPIDQKLILYKKKVVKKEPFFENAEEELRRYLDYYFVSLQYCSPLLPEWTSSVLDSEKSFSEKAVQDITGDYSFFFHEYAKWVFLTLTGERDLSIGDWSRLAAEHFAPIKEAWSGKGRRK
jgi:exodeoxyribonuclease V gamma subunit